MSVTIRIFAKKAKVMSDGDNDHVLNCWYDTNDDFDDLMYNFKLPSYGLNMDDAITLLVWTRAWKEDHKEDEQEDDERMKYIRYWLNHFEAFVKRYPNDTFFAMSNMDERYYDLLDEYEKEMP